MTHDHVADGWSAHQLTQLLQAISRCDTVHHTNQVALERTAESFEAEIGLIVGDSGEVIASVGLGGSTALATPILTALAVGDTAVSLDGLGHTELCGAGDHNSGVRFIVARVGRIPFSIEERTLLRSMARLVHLTLENVQLVNSLRERQELLERLSTIQRSISHRADLDQILGSITGGLSELFGGEIAMIRLLDPARPGTHILASACGLSREAEAAVHELPLEAGAGGLAITSGNLVLLDARSGNDARIPAGMRDDGVCALMAAPIHESGTIAGAIVVGTRRHNRVFSPDEQNALLAFAEHASLALTDADALAGMERANYDPLTKLANRSMFTEQLERALSTRSGHERLAVLFIDLDRFKAINDSLGHAAGDEVLVTVADRIAETLRHDDLVARMGGDEFTALLLDPRSVDEAEAVAERILVALAQPMLVANRRLVVSASVGLAFHDTTAPSGADLVRAADVAMYHAKADGPGGRRTFSSELGERAQRRLDLESALRHAIAHGGLELFYQPLVDITGDTRVVTAEALLRWPRAGAAGFNVLETITLAEETGLIHDLGAWAITEACRQLRLWRELGITSETLPNLHVNVSGHQLKDPRLVATVAALLAQNAIDAEELTLELTESVLIGRDAMSRETLMQLRELGVKLSLDDFGQGYSSLAYLAELDVDCLKVDRCFISRLGEPGAEPVVRHVISLAQELGMRVVAEGVETEFQLERLRSFNCDLAQGHLFSPAVSPDDFQAIITRRPGAVAALP